MASVPETPLALRLPSSGDFLDAQAVSAAMQKADETDAQFEASRESMKVQAAQVEQRATQLDAAVQRKLDDAVSSLNASVGRRSAAQVRILKESEDAVAARLRRVGEEGRRFYANASAALQRFAAAREEISFQVPDAVPLEELRAMIVENSVLFRQLDTLTAAIKELEAHTENGIQQSEVELRREELLEMANTLDADFQLVIADGVEPKEREMETQQDTLETLSDEQSNYLNEVQLFISTGARTQRRLVQAINNIVDSPDSFRTIKRSPGLAERVSGFRQDIGRLWDESFAGEFDAIAQPLPRLAEARNALQHVAGEAEVLLVRMRDGLQRAGLQRARLRKIRFISSRQREQSERIQSGEEVLDVRGGFNSACAKIESRASVQIYEQRPPPSLSLTKFDTHESLQDEVARVYSRFRARAQSFAEATGECFVSTPVLSPYQRFGYHLLHPFQPQVRGVAFNASAGAGKSWLIALLASTHGRAGRTTYTATKPSLRSEIAMAMFRTMADVNVQNMVTGCGIPFDPATFVASREVNETEEETDDDLGYESLDILSADEEEEEDEDEEEDLLPSLAFGAQDKVQQRKEKLELVAKLEGLGLQATRAMGVDLRPYTSATKPSSAVHTYRTLNNIWRKAIKDPSIMANTSWFLDESTRIIAPKADLKDKRDTGNMNTLTEAMWVARETLPLEQQPFLALFTATLFATSAVDVVLQLNPLVTRDRGWLEEFLVHEPMRTEKGVATGERRTLIDETNDRFLAMYFDSNGHFLDDPSIHRRWERLSLGTLSHISMYGDRTHFAKPVFEVQVAKVSKYQAEDLLLALKYEVAEDRLVNSTIATLAPSADGKGRGDKRSRKALASVRTAAPNVYHIVQEMSKRNNQLKDDLEEHNANRDPTDPSPVFHNFKKMVYIASTTQGSARYLLQALEDAGFHSLNPRATKASANKKRSFRSAEPYTGFIEFIDLDNDAPFHTDDSAFQMYNGLTVKQAYLEILNAPENFDGRNCLFPVVSGTYREGLSFNSIKYIVIPGLEVSDDYLVQAMARAIRFCSAKALPVDLDGGGWSINVLMQNLQWPDEYSHLRAKGAIRDAVRDSFPNARKFFGAIEFMKQQVKDAALDKQLFEEINESGQIQIPFHLLSTKMRGAKASRRRRR